MITPRFRPPESGYNWRVSCHVKISGAGFSPEYSSPGAAGADLRANCALSIPPGGRAAVPIDLQVEIPAGFVGLIWPRSGLAVRNGIDTLAGVVDADFRGDVRVVLVNHGDEPFEIVAGDRVAQLLVQPVAHAVFARAESLSETARGAGGFGSTGQR
jgi:dUTP pyrophosphatase